MTFDVKALKQILIVGLLGLITSCSDGTKYINEQFTGYWAETEWTYKFKQDGTFRFIANGHIDTGEYKGRYIISDSTIFLNPDTDWQTFNGVIKPRLKIFNKECLRDYENNFYCKGYETIDKLNEKEFEFQSKIISILDTMSMVKEEKERLIKIKDNRALKVDPEVRIMYSGIIVIDRQEFHQFSVERVTMFDTWRGLDFLVRKRPIEIYEHLSIGDSLRLVFKEKIID